MSSPRDFLSCPSSQLTVVIHNCLALLRASVAPSNGTSVWGTLAQGLTPPTGYTRVAAALSLCLGSCSILFDTSLPEEPSVKLIFFQLPARC